jgi:hypothetical protein
MNRILWLLVATVPLLVASRCGGVVPNIDPDAVILAGDWGTTFENGTDLVLSFDSRGTLVEITQFSTSGITLTRQITGSTSTVSGDEVSVTVPNILGISIYSARLNAAADAMSGNLSSTIVFRDVSIGIPAGTLNFTRLAE